MIQDKALLIDNHYYWVYCEQIDDTPVVAEFAENAWYFCGIKDAVPVSDVEVVDGPILRKPTN